MTKFQSTLRAWLRRSVMVLAVLVIVIVAIYSVKIPMIESWNPPVVTEVTEVTEEPLKEERKLEIRIVYVTGNGVRVHLRPTKASDAISAFNWCKSLIVFAHDREWVEVGEITPMGWMHEGFLTSEKPDRCKKVSGDKEAGWRQITH